MNIAFRADASLQIGNGHIMRCLTLADALRTAGAQCLFICREHPGNLIPQIRQHGFPVHTLTVNEAETVVHEPNIEAQPNHSALLGADWATDAEETKAAVGKMALDWVIVDHYALNARWEKTLRPLCSNLMVIDDLADRPHDCDLLLDQNLGRDAGQYSHLVPNNCTVLAGPHYALLRSEFANMRTESLHNRTTPRIKHLLITMGGVDYANATGKVLEALQDCPLAEDLRITVVMGAHAPWLDHVQLLAKQMPRPTEVKINVSNMAHLMADSDLAIGAAGSTSWERCCLGLPSIVVVLAANQQLIANALEFSGAAKTFNINVGLRPMRALITSVLSDDSLLQQMSKSASIITDGRGVERVIGELKKKRDYENYSAL